MILAALTAIVFGLIGLFLRDAHIHDFSFNVRAAAVNSSLIRRGGSVFDLNVVPLSLSREYRHHLAGQERIQPRRPAKNDSANDG